MKKRTEHVVTLTITKECDDETMTDIAIKRWVEDQFVGCDYGSVKADDVKTTEE